MKPPDFIPLVNQWPSVNKQKGKKVDYITKYLGFICLHTKLNVHISFKILLGENNFLHNTIFNSFQWIGEIRSRDHLHFLYFPRLLEKIFISVSPLISSGI